MHLDGDKSQQLSRVWGRELLLEYHKTGREGARRSAVVASRTVHSRRVNASSGDSTGREICVLLAWNVQKEMLS